jgi:hypothetical protein
MLIENACRRLRGLKRKVIKDLFYPRLWEYYYFNRGAVNFEETLASDR